MRDFLALLGIYGIMYAAYKYGESEQKRQVPLPKLDWIRRASLASLN